MSRYQLLPPLTDDEYTELEADILAHGVLQPILVDEHNVTIDGHHRKQIAEKHGIRCPVVKCPPNLTDEQKRSLSIGMNVHRRHLTREQRRELIAKSLIADPGLSDRQHAERVGADHKTVGSVRSDLEGRGEIPHVDSRTDSAGRSQPVAKVTTTTRTTESTKIERDVDLETGEIVEAGKEGKSAPAPTPLDYDRDAEQEWEDNVHPPRPEPIPEPELSLAEQRARDWEEAKARHARQLQRLISLWPYIDDWADHSDDYRADVLAHLTDHDRMLLARIEARITGQHVFPLDKEAA